MSRAYIRFLDRRLVWVALVLTLITLVCGAGVWKLLGGDLLPPTADSLRHLKLRIDTSDRQFLAAHDPDLQAYQESTRIFGDDRFLVAVLEFDNVFTPDHLALISRACSALSRLPGAKRVTSVTHEPLYSGAAQSLANAQIATRLPKTQAEADRIRDQVLSDSTFVRNLVSADGRYAAIYVRTWPHVRGPELDFLVRRFKQTLQREARNVPVLFAGNHIQTIELHEATLREMKRLLPVTAVIMAIVLALIFHSWRGVGLPLVTMALSLIWTFGVLGWAGVSLTPIDVILPTLLMTLSITYSLQFITRYYQVMEEARPTDKVSCCELAAEDSFFALFIAQFTTIIGTASLCWTDIPAIFQFGAISALGTVFTAVLVYTFLPAAQLVLPMRPRRRRPETSWMERISRRAQGFYLRKEMTLSVAFGVTAVLALGLFALKVENDPKTFFKSDSPIRQAFQTIEDKLGGALSISVVVDGGRPGAMKDPETLRAIESLQTFAEQQSPVLKTISFVDTVKRLNRAVHGDSAAFETVPESSDEISQLLLLAAIGDDPANIDRLVDYDYQHGRLEIRVKNVDSKSLLALASDLQSHVDRTWPRGLHGTVTGDHYMTCRANSAILTGQVRGFLGTAIVVFLVMWICFGSPQIGLIAMIPNVAPILSVLGLMGYFGVRIDVGTALLASVALGIALDDTIHFIIHYIRNIQSHPHGRRAIHNVVGGVGRAMVFSNVALAVGFAVLILSTFQPVRLFGLFMLVSMIIACFDDFVMMPALIGWMPMVGVWEQWRIKFKSDVTQIPLFARMSPADIKKVVSMGRMLTLPANARLMEEGEPGAELFLILEGSVTVRKNKVVVTMLGRGETVGEMGLISDHPRSADVSADKETTVLAFGYEALERLERRYPRLAVRLLHNLSTILSRRLAATTELLK